MKVLRFTGAIGADLIDIRFTTDMIGNGDYFFNITQIQEGSEFDINDKKNSIYLKHFSTTFQETNNNIGAAKQFAIDNALDLRLYNADGTYEFLVNDESTSVA